jgi:transcriptional adapter 2-alpha
VYTDPLDPAALATAQTLPPDTQGAPSTSTKGKAKPGLVDATGFHLKRNEFDPEYDNDAEMVVGDMEFTEQDSAEDIASKVQMLQVS